ncbi:ABC transporter substrate-binding protein [Novosphingobium rosa]|uniref:ABC transporter substrate-binding protein n=1 Tax=Novosphingobium rosa TaxID=76978 RepID=UPI001C3FAD07|nr:ABC transporter substrate-binding protein [Novosphingobium rosa]
MLGASSWRHGPQQEASGASPALIVGDQRGGVQALLKASGELDHMPYTIEWAMFPAAAPLLEALNSGAVDVGGLGCQPFAFAYAGGAKIKVVQAGFQHPSPTRGRSSAIIVAGTSPLRSFADLKGKRLATIRGSAGQDLALRLLEREHLQPGDIHWVYLNNAEAKAALASGAVDAWSTWSAYVGYALLRDHERSLADATALPPQPVFFAASDKAIAGKHTQIADFLQRLSRARHWLAGHKDAYAAVLARETGLPGDVARFTVEDLSSDPVQVDDRLAAEELAILKRYKATGIIDKIPDLTGAFDGSFPIRS